MLYEYLLNQLLDGERLLHEAWLSLLSDNQQEGKSSAGDKHETGAAMLHLEMEQLGKQLEELKRQREEVVRWSPENVTAGKRVVMGSLIGTTSGLYYMITGYGRLNFHSQDVYIIGPSSPMGKALLGKCAGDNFEWGKACGVISSID